MKKRLLLSLLSIMLVSCVAFGFSLTSVNAEEPDSTTSITCFYPSRRLGMESMRLRIVWNRQRRMASRASVYTRLPAA